MFFKVDSECYCKGKTVGIFEASDPGKTLHRTAPDMADKLLKYLNRHEHPESFICESCGRLLIRLEYVKKYRLMLGQKKESEKPEWVAGQVVQWEYLCGNCQTGVPTEQIIQMGVISL